MSVTYKISELQLVRLNNNRPEAAISLSLGQLRDVEKYLAALDTSPYSDTHVLIENELERLLAQDDPV